MFARVDANADGVLSFSEVMIHKTEALVDADKDQDGKLSFEEMVDGVKAELRAVREAPATSHPRQREDRIAGRSHLSPPRRLREHRGNGVAGHRNRRRRRRRRGCRQAAVRQQHHRHADRRRLGGLGGNRTLDRQAEARRQQEQEVARDAEMQGHLDFDRQRALQAAEVERELEVRRLLEEWQRERAAQQG